MPAPPRQPTGSSRTAPANAAPAPSWAGRPAGSTARDPSTTKAPGPGPTGPPDAWVAPVTRGPASNPAMMVVFVVVGMLVVSMLFSTMMFRSGLATGPLLLVVLLVVGLGGLSASRAQANAAYGTGSALPPSEPGLPAPFGAPLYGIPRGARGWSIGDRLAAVEPRRRQLHHMALWGLVALVAAAGLGVLAAIIAGPNGAHAAAAGFVLLMGWVVTLAAYFAAGYRAFLPAACALLVYGLLLHVDAVADAWALATGWNSSGIALFVVLALVQGFGAEAAYRKEPRAFWAAWCALGTLAAMAMPLYLFFEPDGRDADGLGNWAGGISTASLAWGVAALFAFARIPETMRRIGIGVFAAWAVAIAFALGDGGNLAVRLQAAGVVAAAIVLAAAVTAYFVARQRGESA